MTSIVGPSAWMLRSSEPAVRFTKPPVDGVPVFAVAGIACPRQVLRRSSRARVRDRGHDGLSRSSSVFAQGCQPNCRGRETGGAQAIVTTEKDYVRLLPWRPFAMPIECAALTMEPDPLSEFRPGWPARCARLATSLTDQTIRFDRGVRRSAPLVPAPARIRRRGQRRRRGPRDADACGARGRNAPRPCLLRLRSRPPAIGHREPAGRISRSQTEQRVPNRSAARCFRISGVCWSCC